MYYARNNDVWLNHESVDDYYVKVDRVDYSYLDYKKMPDPSNVTIVHDPTYYASIFPNSFRDKVDSFMIDETKSVVVGSPTGVGDSFMLTIYSKIALKATFCAMVSVTSPPGLQGAADITVDQVKYYEVKDKDIIQLPLLIQKGFTKIQIGIKRSSTSAAKSDVSLSDWKINISE